MKNLFFLILFALLLSNCGDSLDTNTVNPNPPEVSPDPDKIQVYISDIQYEWIEIKGGGAFPKDTINHIDTRSFVEIKKKGKPRLVDYEKLNLLPHPKAKATKYLRKRNWR